MPLSTVHGEYQVFSLINTLAHRENARSHSTVLMDITYKAYKFTHRSLKYDHGVRVRLLSTGYNSNDTSSNQEQRAASALKEP
jgi:hypothetical protein